MQTDESYQTNSQLESIGILTFTLSPDDPDQVNGDLQYSLYQNISSASVTLCNYATGSSASCGWLRNNFSHLPLTGRPGWAYFETQFVIQTGADTCIRAQDGSLPCAFNMTVWETGIESRPSCLVNITLDMVNSQSQCGNNITLSPAGISGIVVSPGSTTEDGLIQTRFPLSPTDPDNVSGDFTYEMLVLLDKDTPYQDVDPTDSLDTDGNRIYNFTFYGSRQFFLSLQARAIDPQTRMTSNYTCSIRVDSSILNDVSTCGSVTQYLGTNDLYGEVLFPLIDVPTWSAELGVTETVGKILLVITLGALFGGLFYSRIGTPGALIGTVFGMATGAVFGLMPLWIIVAIFTVAVLVIVLLSRSSQGGEA